MTSTSSSQKRTQLQRRFAARGAIIETAIGLLATHGYANMTLADVGERAGYSRSLATHYFGSKAKLLSAVVAHVLSTSRVAEIDTSLCGMSRIESEIDAIFDDLSDHPLTARAYIVVAHEAATSTPSLLAVIHRQNVTYRDTIELALREGIPGGTIRPDIDPSSVSIAIMAMIRGAVWEWFTDDAVDLEMYRQSLHRQARALCATRPPDGRLDDA